MKIFVRQNFETIDFFSIFKNYFLQKFYLHIIYILHLFVKIPINYCYVLVFNEYFKMI